MDVCLMIEGQEDVTWESTILGTAEEAVEQLRELEAAGLARIMGQHLLHRDLDAVALVGRQIAPALAG